MNVSIHSEKFITFMNIFQILNFIFFKICFNLLLFAHSNFIFPPEYMYLLCNSRRRTVFRVPFSACFHAIYMYLLRLYLFETKLPTSTPAVLYSSKHFRGINKHRQKSM